MCFTMRYVRRGKSRRDLNRQATERERPTGYIVRQPVGAAASSDPGCGFEAFRLSLLRAGDRAMTSESSLDSARSTQGAGLDSMSG